MGLQFKCTDSYIYEEIISKYNSNANILFYQRLPRLLGVHKANENNQRGCTKLLNLQYRSLEWSRSHLNIGRFAFEKINFNLFYFSSRYSYFCRYFFALS